MLPTSGVVGSLIAAAGSLMEVGIIAEEDVIIVVVAIIMVVDDITEAVIIMATTIMVTAIMVTVMATGPVMGIGGGRGVTTLVTIHTTIRATTHIIHPTTPTLPQS